MLILIRTLAVCNSVVISLLFSPQINADMTDILVYKGELRFVLPADQERDSMLIQFRSKTRQVMRITIDGLIVTNVSTNRYVRLPHRTASLINHVDDEGYWTTDILYEGLNLTNDSHRVEGRIIQYLIGSQRTRNFNVYLRPESNDWPTNSSIDWGLDN